jgi:UDP-glucose 6-dehydrogenase
VIFICVNTPPKADSADGKYGKEADMTYFCKACETIAASGDPANHRILIEKSKYQE